MRRRLFDSFAFLLTSIVFYVVADPAAAACSNSVAAWAACIVASAVFALMFAIDVWAWWVLRHTVNT